MIIPFTPKIVKISTFFSSSMRMSRKNVNFEDKKKKKKKKDFYKNKKVTKIDAIDVNKILVSKEEQYGT